jgi:hypothetical protein
MYRLLFSILYEIENSAVKPNGRIYGVNEYEFRELVLLVSQLGFICGEIITFTHYSLTGATLTEKGKEFLKEHFHLLQEYPVRSNLPGWIREEAVYTRRL